MKLNKSSIVWSCFCRRILNQNLVLCLSLFHPQMRLNYFMMDKEQKNASPWQRSFLTNRKPPSEASSLEVHLLNLLGEHAKGETFLHFLFLVVGDVTKTDIRPVAVFRPGLFSKTDLRSWVRVSLSTARVKITNTVRTTRTESQELSIFPP